MDYEVAWSPAALEDVESLADFIARDSEFYARAVVEKILDTARKLKDFPSAGPSCLSLRMKPSASALCTATGSFTEWRAIGSRSWQSFMANGLLIY